MTKLHVLNNQRPDLCGPCGGKCCQSAPGAYFPADFGETEAEIRAGVRAALLAGTAALSDSDEDPYVRPPIRDYDGIVQEIYVSPIAQYTGVYPKAPCANLTASGCLLEFDHRPTQCRALAPDPAARGGAGCKLPREIDNPRCREAWAPYRDLFEELI